jgi:hypothetical protein
VRARNRSKNVVKLADANKLSLRWGETLPTLHIYNRISVVFIR